jgi:hypothetical protein
MNGDSLMTPVSDYIRLPMRPGATLLPYRKRRPTVLRPDAPDYFRDFIDATNGRLIVALNQRLPEAGLHLCYARGSAVSDRLDQAGRLWPRAVALFQLEETLACLAEARGAGQASSVVVALKQAMLARLLYDERKMGAAKLLFRIKRPDERLLSGENLPAIEAFVDGVARLMDGLNDDVVTTLKESRQPRLDKYVRRELERVLLTSGLADLAAKVLPRFPELLELESAHDGLNPLQPLDAAVIEATARFIEVDEGTAERLLKLQRFAYLTCLLRKPKYFSDFTFKSVTVLQRDDLADISALNGAFERVLDAVEAVQQGEECGRFRQAYPNLFLDHKAYVFVLPQPIYEAYIAALPETRLDLLSLHRAGRRFFRNRLAALTPGRARQTVRWDATAMWTCDYEEDHRGDFVPVRPLGMTPARLSKLIDAVTEDSTATKQCADFLNAVLKNDISGITRGVWLEK